MFELTWIGWATVMLGGFMLGISKTAIPGMGILVIPLMATVIPARASTGFILPMLIAGDIFAVAFYRRHAVWRHLVMLLPWAILGLIPGYYALKVVNDDQLRPIIGTIVLVLLLVSWWRNQRLTDESKIPTQWWFAAALGFAAGVTTMMANAAGPIMVIYLVAMRLPKSEFIGTGAWYFLIVNSLKVPFSANLGLINAESLKLNLMILPVLALGAVVGIFLLKKIPEKKFSGIVQILAALAALKLVISG